MINLLPESLKKKSQGEWLFRLATFVVVVVCVEVALASLPLFVYLQNRTDLLAESKAVLASEKQKQSVDKENKSIEDQVAALGQIETKLSPREIIDTIMAAKGPSVRIVRIRVSVPEKKVSIDAEVETRQALLLFEENINKIAFVKSFNLPVTDLLKASNIKVSGEVKIKDAAI